MNYLAVPNGGGSIFIIPYTFVSWNFPANYSSLSPFGLFIKLLVCCPGILFYLMGSIPLLSFLLKLAQIWPLAALSKGTFCPKFAKI